MDITSSIGNVPAKDILRGCAQGLTPGRRGRSVNVVADYPWSLVKSPEMGDMHIS